MSKSIHLAGAILLLALVSIVTSYGVTYSLTSEVWPIQGWVGAALPGLFVICGAAIGWVAGRG